MQDSVLTLSHDDLGHLGRDKTIAVAQERYFWVGLTDSVEQKLKSCKRCQCAKSPYLPERAPLVSITTTRPLELVCIDFLSLEESQGRFNSVLVITDHFTNFAMAVPTRNQEAKTVAKCLVNEFIVHYGIPERFHSDKGACFMGRVITHMCGLLNIDKSNTTIFHPQGNAKTERFNRSLISMLRTLEPEKKVDWKSHVPFLVHAYNCCRHSSTGYSPYYLMFGRSPRLAVDIFLGKTEPPGQNSTASQIRDNLAVAYNLASQAAKQASSNQQRNYNKKVRGTILDVGDFVLTRNVNLKGKNKLADKWNSALNIIAAQPNKDIPVYVVRAEDSSREKVLHRNLLLPLILPWPQRDVDVESDVIVSDDDSSEDMSDEMSEMEVQFATEQLPIPHVDDVSVQAESVDNQMQDDIIDVEPIAVDANVDYVFNESVVVPERIEQTLSPVRSGRAPAPTPQPAPPPRCSTRANRGVPPVRLGDYVSHGQFAGIQCELLAWQLKVAALMQLLPIFPMFHQDICHAIIYVISHQ